MICRNCGNPLNNGENVCPRCGHLVSIVRVKSTIGFLPSMILGILGSVFGLFGGFQMTMCTILATLNHSGLQHLIFVFGGSVVGLIGACKCLNNVLIGSIMELIAAIMIIICAYSSGGGLMTIFSMLLFITAGLIGIIYYFIAGRR